MDGILMFTKTFWPQGVICPCTGAIYMYMTIIFKHHVRIELTFRRFLTLFCSPPKEIKRGGVHHPTLTYFLTILKFCIQSYSSIMTLFRKVQVGKDQEKAQSEKDTALIIKLKDDCSFEFFKFLFM